MRPPPDPTPASLRADQRLRSMHNERLAAGCNRCVFPGRPVCPDCYRCLLHANCAECRPLRKGPPGRR